MTAWLLLILSWIAPAGADAPPAPDPSLERARRIGETIDRAWILRRPEWFKMALAILKGDLFDPSQGWWPSGSKTRDWAWLASRYDADGDAVVTAAELPLDERRFEMLDANGDGVVTPADFDAPASQEPSVGRAMFRAFDRDHDGRVTMEDLERFFRSADPEELGFLTPGDVERALRDPSEARSREKSRENDDSDMPTPLQMLHLLFTGQMGSLTEGPRAGEVIPEVSLTHLDGGAAVPLSKLRKGRPFVIAFGSFT
ncbi:MAG TPA: EF-hand domain-containing protein [Planctomycetota bacterium]|nr:EF-hand domain-containing protein [Planctomycetota bacterium]